MDNFRNELIKFIFSKFSTVNDVFFEEYSFQRGDGTFYETAYSTMEDLNIVASIPNDSKNSFICISKSAPSEVCKILSSIQHYNEDVSKLGYGHTVPLSTSSYAVDRGWSSALMLTPDVLIDNFESSLENKFKNNNIYLLSLIHI